MRMMLPLVTLLVALATIASTPGRFQSSESWFHSTDTLARPPEFSHAFSVKSPYGGRNPVVSTPTLSLMAANAVENSFCSADASSLESCWCW